MQMSRLTSCLASSDGGKGNDRIAVEAWKVEVQTSRLTSCLASGDGGSGKDCVVVCRLDLKTTIEWRVSSFVAYLDHILLRIKLKDN